MQKLKPIGIYLLCLLYPLIVMAGNYTFFDIVDPNRAYVAGNRATMMDDYSVTKDYEMCTNAVGATTDCTPKVVSDTNAGDANLVLVDNVASFDLHRGGTVLWVSAKVPPIGADGNATLDADGNAISTADGNTVVDASGNTVIV
ncbi:MAG: hypothetical protein ISR65_20215, partial [Bacteriovoracaceae bacterium]|nr:hypothetical protein [Bacteriovoracaceae bacterium]